MLKKPSDLKSNPVAYFGLDCSAPSSDLV
jgi:hypothetical protein